MQIINYKFYLNYLEFNVIALEILKFNIQYNLINDGICIDIWIYLYFR